MNVAAWLAAGILLAIPLLGQSSRSFKVIVNAKNPLSEMTRRRVSYCFFKQTRYWYLDAAEGQQRVPVQPIDLIESSDVRRSFSTEVLGGSVAKVLRRWQSAIFSGRESPPPQVATDEQVIEFVRGNVGGIGYVSSDVELGDGVKELTVVYD